MLAFLVQSGVASAVAFINAAAPVRAIGAAIDGVVTSAGRRRFAPHEDLVAVRNALDALNILMDTAPPTHREALFEEMEAEVVGFVLDFAAKMPPPSELRKDGAAASTG
jgi:hypothetical protein